MALLALLEALALLEVLVLQVELAHTYPREQTEQTERLHQTVQTITMWLQRPLTPLTQGLITTIVIRQYTLTNTGTRLLLIIITSMAMLKAHIGIMVGTIITHTMMDLMVVSITGMVTIGMLGVLISTVMVTGVPATRRMDIKNQTDTIPTMNLRVTDIIILWSITVLLVDMMGMFMRTLGYHTIAIRTHITHTQALITIITTIQ
jgi:hypothetical protein